MFAMLLLGFTNMIYCMFTMSYLRGKHSKITNRLGFVKSNKGNPSTLHIKELYLGNTSVKSFIFLLSVKWSYLITVTFWHNLVIGFLFRCLEIKVLTRTWKSYYFNEISNSKEKLILQRDEENFILNSN